MFTIETFEIGSTDWDRYHQSGDTQLPVVKFPRLQEAAEFAKNLSQVELCLARVVSPQGAVVASFDDAKEYDPEKE